MDDSEDRPGAGSELVVERGETYTHVEHGRVDVTGIWKGVEQVDKAHHSEEKDVYIVRYSTEIDGKRVDELTDTVEEFLRSIDES